MRSLVLVVAVIAVALAWYLRFLELPVAGGILAMIALLIWIVSVIRNRSRRTTVTTPHEEDLAAVGIISIKAAKPATPALQNNGPAPDDDAETLPEDADDHASDEEDMMTEPTAIPANDPPHVGLPNAYNTDILAPILEGFRAALGAHAVCVLRQEGDKYTVVGTAGPHFAKLAGDSFETQVPLMTSPRKFRILAVRKDIPGRTLGYSRGPGSVLRVAVVPIGATPMILLADTIQEDGFLHPRPALSPAFQADSHI